MMQLNMTESQIQTQIKKQLEKSGWLVNKMIQTTLNGWPDLQAHRDGVTVFIECKRPGLKPTPLQLYRHEQLRKQGFEVIGCASSIKDVEHLN